MPESEIWDWLHFFRQTFLDQLKGPSPKPSINHPIFIEKPLSQLRGQYCRTERTRHSLKSKGKTQLDFLVKSIDFPNEEPAEFENINLLGEFTKLPSEEERKKKFIKLSRSVREVFCAQPLRRYLHGFYLFGDEFELWIFDRSGAYSAGPKKIVDDKEMLVRAISSYLLMSNEELCCDMSILQNGEDRFVHFPKIGDVPGPLFEIKPEPMVQPTRLITRGTTCFETKDEMTMIKYSWTNSKENTEIDFLNIAKTVRGVVNIIASEVIYDTKSHMDNLEISSATPWELSAAEDYTYSGTHKKEIVKPSFVRNRRLIRIAMTPSGRTIYSSGTILDFVMDIRDAIKGHEGLVGKENLDGDISEGNIILLKTSPANDLHGMLIDFDLSVMMKGNLASEDRQSLTGTIKFMALERLQHACDTGESIRRTCRHDRESFFNVFIVGCIEYEEVSANKSKNLDRWCTNEVENSFTNKRDSVVHFDKILIKFTASFKGLKDLAKMLRKILFNDDGEYIETPQDCGPLYRKIIKAFEETIEDIKGKI
ncbi:Bgt-20565 [Blumeria graminis f. sp. tritici]|uniref:Bgt-20565 n=1 Tax=Blumeria graminis f. sp. tritici TaxID=62690 RepID=A0A9X9PRP6_BLUGR|nr:Bgt-20565 [Blumeria graminis f. sp. tritici]